MSLSGDFSSGSSVNPNPSAPAPMAPPGGGRPKWLIPVILGVLGCCIIACIVGAIALGPTLSQSMNLATMCVANNPSASQESCQLWVTDVIQNHQTEYTSCEASSGGDVSVTYQCLLDAGVSAP